MCVCGGGWRAGSTSPMSRCGAAAVVVRWGGGGGSAVRLLRLLWWHQSLESDGFLALCAGLVGVPLVHLLCCCRPLTTSATTSTDLLQPPPPPPPPRPQPPRPQVVINYSFPLTTEDYVHRIGRTGRAGKTGAWGMRGACVRPNPGAADVASPSPLPPLPALHPQAWPTPSSWVPTTSPAPASSSTCCARPSRCACAHVWFASHSGAWGVLQFPAPLAQSGAPLFCPTTIPAPAPSMSLGGARGAAGLWHDGEEEGEQAVRRALQGR